LFGVYRRRFGTADGFSYSNALRNRDGRWTQENLDQFLAAPSHFLPGTTMDVEGIKNATQRELIIAYLRSLR
jgi:cytochrome c